MIEISFRTIYMYLQNTYNLGLDDDIQPRYGITDATVVGIWAKWNTSNAIYQTLFSVTFNSQIYIWYKLKVQVVVKIFYTKSSTPDIRINGIFEIYIQISYTPQCLACVENMFVHILWNICSFNTFTDLLQCWLARRFIFWVVWGRIKLGHH